jgi:hypothetical protein
MIAWPYGNMCLNWHGGVVIKLHHCISRGQNEDFQAAQKGAHRISGQLACGDG